LLSKLGESEPQIPATLTKGELPFFRKILKGQYDGEPALFLSHLTQTLTNLDKKEKSSDLKSRDYL
jgi:hypothetical protein